MMQMQLRARQYTFEFPGPALMMGILNVTPDSFSDGGRFMDPSAALDRALEMIAQGAGILDIGGESTRPRSEPVAEAEELRRVIPVIERLASRVNVPISIDTMKEEVARQAVRAGAAIINDVASGQHKPGMWQLAMETGCAYVCMHMQGIPRTMQVKPVYADVVAEVTAFLEGKLRELCGCGIIPQQIILDPGIGFGKTAVHNVELLAGINRMAALGRPVLVGVSRKSFLGGHTGAPAGERLAAGLACACLTVAAGANIIRTHDVAETLQAVRMAEEILKHSKPGGPQS